MSHATTAPALDELRNTPTVSVETASRLLGVSRSFGFELARRGEFPCRVLRVGTRYRVPSAALLALLEAAEVAAS